MWVFTRVYGPTLCKEREDFWAELGDIRGLWDDPWCFGGGFNAVRFTRERRYSDRVTATIRHFPYIIEELHLRDILLTGGSFTWCEGENNRSHLCLDCFLVFEKWERHFNGLLQSVLPKPMSDYSLVLLDREG